MTVVQVAARPVSKWSRDNYDRGYIGVVTTFLDLTAEDRAHYDPVRQSRYRLIR